MTHGHDTEPRQQKHRPHKYASAPNAGAATRTKRLERLRQLVDKAVIEPLDGAAYEEAYHFIQQTRMQQHQLQTRENRPYSNRVDPDSLNQLDRRILREALRQAQRLQSSLALRYQL